MRVKWFAALRTAGVSLVRHEIAVDLRINFYVRVAESLLQLRFVAGTPTRVTTGALQPRRTNSLLKTWCVVIGSMSSILRPQFGVLSERTASTFSGAAGPAENAADEGFTFAATEPRDPMGRRVPDGETLFTWNGWIWQHRVGKAIMPGYSR